MNGSYGNNNTNQFIVHLRGLPWNTARSEIEKFLQGCKIRQVNFATNDSGRATGDCFVVFESQEDLDIAKNFHQTNLGSRMYRKREKELSHRCVFLQVLSMFWNPMRRK